MAITQDYLEPITKKTIQAVAKENNLDISEANAQKVADAYIQPTLDALTKAEQQAVASNQTALRALENNYFNQYREDMYKAQSRGLSGGLANIDTNRLRMQMGQANAALAEDLIQQQADIEADRGTALSNAQSYKTKYLNGILSQVSALREQDYAQRYEEWKFLNNLRQRQAEAAQQQANWEKNYALKLQNFELNKQQAAASNAAADIQAKAYQKEYAEAMLPDVVNTYRSLRDQGRINEAADYLNTKIAELEGYGYRRSEITNAINNIDAYSNASESYESLRRGVNASKFNKNLGNAFGWGNLALAGFTGGLSLIPSILAFNSKKKAEKSYNDLYSELVAAENILNNKATNIPTWYQSYLGQ